MERCRKKDILSLIRTMMEANNSVAKALPAVPEELTDVFVQCQDAALQIGTQLENLGEQYQPIVAMLEDYCEKVYQMSIVTSDENVCRKLSKKIRKQLTELQTKIQAEMPKDRKEIVFLPYKASMWDSLESVWKAADEDEGTDAYVIPIPYYDKNPDGSFREEHYEGDQYPEYVPITRYDTYDFGSRRPDIIFIHNPYDNLNYVTSIHPFFYSGNLKKFTDKLVYISYFILGEPDVENDEALEGMQHFCVTTGVFNADKVIVQSENMKKAYVKILTNFMKKQTGENTRKHWEEKILGLGSPKIDKVMATRKEDVAVPKEWMKVIEKPDGSWKKIIFYNTSVQALLEHNEKMNAKIRDVLRVFKENKDEVALLWRPHPLIEATIKSVRLRLWEEYKEIVETYKSEGWGIYDDTAELDRAIAVSDAYYGDGSSVVQLFQKSEKPIMLQNIELLMSKQWERYEYEIAAAEAICSYKGDYYFVYTQKPLLCRMNRETLECELLYQFQGERTESRIYRKMIPYQNKLFIVPFYAERVAVYDIASGEMLFIPLNEDYIDMRWQENQVSIKFEDAIPQGRFLYMIPYSYHALVRLDMESLMLEEFPLGKKSKERFCYCLGSACIQKSWIAFPIYSEGSICLFNIDTNEINRIYPSGIKKKYSNVFAICNQLWLIPEKLYEGIDIWDIESGVLRQKLMLSDEINRMSQKNENVDIRLGFLQKDKLYLVPCRLEHGLIINVDSGIAELWEFPYEYKKEEFSSEYSYLYGLRHSSVLLEQECAMICGLRGEWTVCEQGEIYLVKRQSVLSENLILALLEIQPGKITWENRTVNLGKYITLRSKGRTLSKAEGDNIGRAVYEYISRQGG